MDSNRQEGLVFTQPKSFAERRSLARVLVEKLDYRLPLALESYAGERLQLSALWKERPLFLVFGSCT